MGKSKRIWSHGLRAIFSLVSDCRDLGDDAVSWRTHFMNGLGRLIDADMGAVGEMAGCMDAKNIDMGVVFWSPGGFAPPPFWHSHLERFRENPSYSPALCSYHTMTRQNRGEPLLRDDFISDRDWYGSHDFLKIQEPLGLDATVWCFRQIPQVKADESSGFLLMRNKGRRNYSLRDRAIVGEAHAVIADQIGGSLARFAEPSPLGLTPRQREVLGCLLEGDSDKQIALRLGMAPQTVNGYTKVIFRHFGAQSRAELLARWIRRGWRWGAGGR